MTVTDPALDAPDTPRFAEFVALVASFMALTAFALDAILPALPAIGASLDVPNPNDRQLVIGALIVGFGLGQIFCGPLSDRYGRRPLLVGGLLLFTLSSISAAFAQTYDLLLFSRFVQGLAVAATRVLAVSIVRDRFVGARMAQVMSFAMMMFMAVPVIAPIIGQGILAIASWRWIFGAFIITGIAVGVWSGLRLPETLAEEDQQPLTLSRIARGWRITLTERKSCGYMVAGAFLSGGLFGFINSIQQIIFDTYGRPNMLPIAFAFTAGSMAIASLLNSRIVIRLGTRRVSHVALFTYIGFAAAASVVAWASVPSFSLFLFLLIGSQASFGLCGANFGAMAMEEMGKIAGTAASVQGAVGVMIGGLIGITIGQYYDGTTLPLSLGFLICGLCALAVVLITERGRLFANAHPPSERRPGTVPGPSV
jgi:DHA1 family bicyclomycin/chloramphenicol resistance-like MFS transporter